MAKPEADKGSDKLQKPSDSSQKAGAFSGEKHPLAQKDAQQILKSNDGQQSKQEPNAFEQFLQTAQKVTQAAQDAVGTAVDTTKKIAHDVTQTIQSGGDLGKQIEKSADTVVAKTLEEKNKIDKAAGRNEKQSEAENKFAYALYEAKKHDTQEAYSAVSAYIDKGMKSQDKVVEAATHQGDVAKAIEKHADTILEGALNAKEKIDRLIGRSPATSYNENLKFSLAHGVSKSLVKGAVGIVTLADRPQDQDIQLMNKVNPSIGLSLAAARNIGDAVGGAWNAGGKYLDHVNKVGMQAAGTEAMQSAQTWAVHAKPYEWAEKATDTAMLVTGVGGLAKTGLSVLGKMRMVQQGVAATETLAGGVKAGAAMETAVAETAGAVKTEAAATQVESAATKAHPTEATAKTQGDSASMTVKEAEAAAQQSAKLDALAQEATTQLVEKVHQVADDLYSNLRSMLKNADDAIQQTLKELNPEGIDPKKLPGPQQKAFNSLTNEWKKLKNILGQLDSESGLTNKQLFDLTKQAAKEANKLKPVNKILEGAGKAPIDTNKLSGMERIVDRAKQLIESIDPKNKLTLAYQQAARAAESGASVSTVRAAIATELEASTKGSSELVNLKKICQELNPKHAKTIEQAINQELELRQIDWPGATKVRTGEQIGAAQLGSEDFLASARGDANFKSMRPESQKIAEEFIRQNLTDRSYAYKIEKLPGDDHYMATVVDVSDHLGGVKMYQQEIKAGQNIFGVRHVLAHQNKLGIANETPYFKVVNIKIEGKQGVAGMHEGTAVEPWEIDKNKYQIYDHQGKVKGKEVPEVNFAFDSGVGGFIQDTQHYIDYLTKMLKEARLPHR